MSFKCDGCQKKCELNSTKVANPLSSGFYDTYYMPTINNLLINSYMNQKGKTIHVSPLKTVEEAIMLAQQISIECAKHKTNSK